MIIDCSVSGLGTASTLPGRVLLRRFEKLFHYESIVALELAGCKDEGHRTMFSDKVAELRERSGGVRRTEFLQVPGSELGPFVWMGVIPKAKFGRGREIAKPCGKNGISLGDSAGPEPIDEDAGSIGGRR
jgi:hypothetical protein